MPATEAARGVPIPETCEKVVTGEHELDGLLGGSGSGGGGVVASIPGQIGSVRYGPLTYLTRLIRKGWMNDTVESRQVNVYIHQGM